MSGESHIERARRLRAEQTPPEAVLWSALRDRRLGGHKFRRQHPVAGLTVDFFCESAQLAVELDSRYHNGRRADDKARDVRLESLGIAVIRVTASQLTTDRDGVLHTILRRTKERIKELNSA